MNIRFPLVLFALLAFAQPLPAAADSTPTAAAPAAQTGTASYEACLAKAQGDRLAQIDCCKGHKGICGCRAGKIVCCDNTTSNEPGCTCHGDEGFVE